MPHVNQRRRQGTSQFGRPRAESLEARMLLSASATFGATASTNVAGLVAGIGDLQTADFNGDGKQDLVVGVNRNASGASVLTGTEILLSNGDGTFTQTAGPDFPGGASSESTGAFAPLPLDGNARTDLLYASQNTAGKGVLTVETNTGTGSSISFQAGATTTLPTATDLNPQQVLALNLHNTTSNDAADTAQLDVAVLGLNDNGGEDLVILSGNGDGTFTMVDDFTILNVTDGQLIAGSFFGTSGTDLAVFDPSRQKLYTFENGVQSAAVPSAASTLSFSEAPAQLDLDVPGFTAGSVAALPDSTDQLIVPENATGGGGAEIVPFSLSPGGASPVAAPASPAAAGAASGYTVGAIAVGNFDGTGDPDIADAYGVNIGDGSLYAGPTPALSAASGKSGFSAIVATDLTGDGKLDVAAADAATSQVRVALNDTASNASLTATSISVSSNKSPYASGGKLINAFVQDNSGGEVQFFNGTTLLDTSVLSGQQNNANFRFPSPNPPANLSVKFLGNNVYAASGASVTPTPTPTGTDVLTPAFGTIRLPSASIVPGNKLHLSVPIVVTNTGTGTSPAASDVALFVSATPDVSGGTQVASGKPNLRLAPKKSRTVRLAVPSLPATLPAGSYYFVAEVTDGNGSSQTVATATPFAVAAAFVDLTGLLHPLPATLKAGKTVPVTVMVTNNGNTTAANLLQVQFFARPAGTSGSADVSLGTPGVRVSIPGGASRAVRFRLVLPTTLASGDSYSLVAVLDPNNVFNESDSADKMLTGSTFTIE